MRGSDTLARSTNQRFRLHQAGHCQCRAAPIAWQEQKGRRDLQPAGASTSLLHGAGAEPLALLSPTESSSGGHAGGGAAHALQGLLQALPGCTACCTGRQGPGGTQAGVSQLGGG